MGLAIDAAIVAVYFLSITSIGLYMGRREGSLEDFALGGRRMPWWAVMASIVAAETSAATFLGVPVEGYSTRSLSYVQLAYGIILGRVIVGYFFIRKFYEYKVYTVYDFLGIRFGPLTKSYVSALFLIMRTLASGTRLFIPALVMVLAWKMLLGSHDTTFSQPSSVYEYVVAITLLTLITCAYTAIGGIKAVIWTDVIQAALMFASALVAIATLLYHIGGDSWNLLHGLHQLASRVPELRQLRGYLLTGFEPSQINAWKSAHHLTAQMSPWDYTKMILANTYALPTAVIGYTVMCVGAFGVDQDMVQRMLTAPDYKKSRRSIIVAAFMDLPIFAIFAFIGVLLFVFYQQHPNLSPHAAADVFGQYILNTMPTGVRGIVLAGIFATAMGSLSAALNALATTATNDWYLKWARPNQPPEHYVFIARLFTAFFALLMIAVAAAFAYAKVHTPDLRIIPVVLGVAGLILGPMLGVFLIGLFTQSRGSDRGNILAITAGLLSILFLAGLWIDPLNYLLHTSFHPTWLPTISFTWFSTVGCAVVCALSSCFETPVKSDAKNG